MSDAWFVEQRGPDGMAELVLGGRWTLRSIAAAGLDWRARLQLAAACRHRAPRSGRSR